jgi:uncharacterized protein YqjF (DUF2071 family)
MKAAFLTAEWRHLVMANFAVDPEVLKARVPRGTELDQWRGTTYLSLVAFRFLDTRVRGLPVPFHRHFEEINLRFYVRRRHADEWRRGVVFIREIVPRAAVAFVARVLYNEPYVALRTRHAIDTSDGLAARYEWRHRGSWCHLGASAPGAPEAPPAGSEAQFITEHYWGYTPQRDGGTVEYEVEHPPWRVWAAKQWTLEVDVARLYGTEFVDALRAKPTSVCMAEGSAIAVSGARRLPPPGG